MSDQNEERSSFMDYAVGKIVVGAIFLGGAYWLYGVFYELQTGVRESVQIHWLIAILYNSLGPTLSLLIMVLIGILAIVFGIIQLLRERKN